MVKLQLSFRQMGSTIQVFGFPYLPPAEVVKNFLEQYTGRGTVVALEVKASKGGRRAYARVQFTSSTYAEIIINKAEHSLYYGSSYLKAWESDVDIVRNPRTFVHEVERLTLNFGCQISPERFSVLWKGEHVSVKFGTGMKKMLFFLCHNKVEYKLQLAYENIWQIVLYNAHGQAAKCLVIQVELNYSKHYFLSYNTGLCAKLLPSLLFMYLFACAFISSTLEDYLHI